MVRGTHGADTDPARPGLWVSRFVVFPLFKYCICDRLQMSKFFAYTKNLGGMEAVVMNQAGNGAVFLIDT